MMKTVTEIQLKVLTLNLHAGVNWYGQFDPDGILAVIRGVDPDLCGLQEVDRHWAYRSRFQDLAKILASELERDAHFAAALNLGIGAYGNLILSKYPILERWTQRFPGRKEPRSFGSVRIQISGVTLQFITTHLGLSEEERHEQVQQIQNYLCQCTDPVIVTGDFNCEPEGAAVQALTAGLNDLQKAWGMERQGTFRLEDGWVGPRIDYILASPEFTVEDFRVLNSFVSDHLPLMARLFLRMTGDETKARTVFCQNGRL